jgi:S-DNA-T family DNA segregation ATPase FtsK/SpoIIIE
VLAGRTARGAWMMAARGTGRAARSIGQARHIEPGHRRDGIALVLLGAAVIVAASSWFDAARPVGAWVDAGLRIFIGSAVVLLPLVAAAAAIVLMRTEPNSEARPRLILGSSLIALSFLGLRHLWAGSPEDPAPRRLAAGFIGFAIGGPLSDGLTAWIAAPLLFIGGLFGVLLLTGITIREVPEALRGMFGTRLFQREYDEYDEYDEDFAGDDADTVEVPPAEDFSDGYYDQALDDQPRAWPTAQNPATEEDPDEVPTLPEPAVARTRRRGAKKQDRRNL